MSIAATSPKLPNRIRAFVDEGVRADQAMQKSGLGYEAQAVHDYLAAKARGDKPRRPKAVRWRG
jgi:hypothetical protein